MKNVFLNNYIFISALLLLMYSCKMPSVNIDDDISARQSTSIDSGWKFYKYEKLQDADSLIYDTRPDYVDTKEVVPADAKPTEAVLKKNNSNALKPWIMPTGNDFISNPKKRFKRPKGNPGNDFAFVQKDFKDSAWTTVSLPHDWAISEPFLEGWDANVGGGMGRLPSPGIAWYRKKIFIPKSDQDKSIFLDIDGIMSYAMVWVNGNLAGGWPYGYTSWRLDITPYISPGEYVQLAIRVDNPPNSSRWYPGGGIYRSIKLTKTNSVHVAHWGTFINTPEVSTKNAKISFELTLQNDLKEKARVKVKTQIFELDARGNMQGTSLAEMVSDQLILPAGSKMTWKDTTHLTNPKLWGPPPAQVPNRYMAVSKVYSDETIIDIYKTPFGIRSLNFDPEHGLLVNDKKVYLKGVNQHHDLGALGAAFNLSAAKRQLEVLKELGANAIRMAHNPPDPKLLELTDEMGFLVIDELYDSWERKKNPLDFHLIFSDWSEQDIRAMVRRDRNHPSIIMWSTGNEVGEQYTGEDGAAIAKRLRKYVLDEDPTRPITASMNYAKPNMPLPKTMEVLSLNYQGEGIRNSPGYAHLPGINTPPLYPDFHKAFPDKMIISSENAAALSTRGTYIFPVTKEISAPVSDTTGGDSRSNYVSSYELYTAPFGSSADKVFESLDKHPYVAGGFVWSGWDYLGEPTPYYLARSSYFGLIDLAGFKKDRFYLYQSRWRPNLPMAHILPHWNWKDRLGKITPVHVFTSGDEAELFLNGKSLGKKSKKDFQYRLRWDDVLYTPGELKVVTYKNGQFWAENIVKTTGEPYKLELIPEQKSIKADGKQLAFVQVKIVDSNGRTVPNANNLLHFKLNGSAQIVATDNGDPTDMTSFVSHSRNAFNGSALVILKSRNEGNFKLTVSSQGLQEGSMLLVAKN